MGNVYYAAVKVAASPPMSFETAITIILAALAVLLAVLALIIGIFAFYGYVGLRKSLREMAIARVDEAMIAKLREYPQSGEMLELVQRFKIKLDFLDQVQSQLGNPPESKNIEKASKDDNVQQEAAVESAAPYPGEEEPNASGDNPATPKLPSDK